MKLFRILLISLAMLSVNLHYAQETEDNQEEPEASSQNVSDTLNLLTKKNAELLTKINENDKTINSLNQKLSETSNNLTSVTEEKDNMSFLGILISKGAYSAILWTIITSLFLLLLFFIYKFRSSNNLTQVAKTNLAELEVEYEEHRRRALEREQKISRQYQDEINKNKKAK